jgi:DNA-3-methyladenine glycosylase
VSEERQLGEEFFARRVHEVAQDLIGCTLIFGQCGGVIVETESYERDDPACHAYVGRTQRNRVLFGPPGRAYVYLSYGIHNLLNAVAEPEGEAAAVLIRAIEPTVGIELMRRRRGQQRLEALCSGPGKLTQALGIALRVNGASLCRSPFAILPRAGDWRDVTLESGPRVGISKATEYQWRFCAAGSPHVSRPWPSAQAARAA